MQRLLLPLLLSLSVLASCKKDDDGGTPAPTTPEPELRSFTLNGSASSSHNTAAENKAAKAIFSMEDGLIYTYEEASDKQSTLDFTVRTSYYNGAPPTSTADIFIGSIAHDYYVGEPISAFGVKNSAYVATLPHEKMQEYFTDLKRKTQLDSIFTTIAPANLTETGNLLSGGKSLLAFKDHRGKRGVMTVTNYSAVKPFDFVVSVKMEK